MLHPNIHMKACVFAETDEKIYDVSYILYEKHCRPIFDLVFFCKMTCVTYVQHNAILPSLSTSDFWYASMH